MSAKFAVSAATRKARARAVDPAASAWVTANAGSGKTFVLTERVLRLLLSGVPPEELLCLTYTRAAAAEMRDRVSRQLGRWALLDEAGLTESLTDLLGTAPDEATGHRARGLFAHALDTPGGLKINTIHAFCESVLHRFPLEAGLPFDFTVIEQADRDALVGAAREAVLAEGLDGDGELAMAVETLHSAASDTSIEDALNRALGLGLRLETVLADPAAASANLRRALGLTDAETLAAIDAEIVDGAIIPLSEYGSLAAHLATLSQTGGFADKLAAAAAGPLSAKHTLAAFLTQKGAAPKSLNVTKSIRSQPEIADRIEAETVRLAALSERRAAAAAFENSAALMAVLAAILTRYRAAKRARALVDFDDLVARLRALLLTSPEKWVAYKLDARIAHVLVDESQDTNPEQWAIIEALTGEFFSGRGIDRGDRTVFAVGDEKQSIFSFQGAEPHLFAEIGRTLKRRAEDSANRWHDVELKTSFRTLTPVLAGIDGVFASPDAHRGLERPPRETAHEAARTEKGGFMELWPPVERPEQPEPGAQYLTDPIQTMAAERQLAEHIAATIADWIKTGRTLSGTRRAVTPGDVLVLVQQRGPLFHHIVDALKRRGLPNAGADKLSVTGHIAVQDLTVLGDVMLNTADDLALATVLRSPLFSVSEAQLETLCTTRGKSRLWPALGRLAASEPWAAAARDRLTGWRNRLDLDRPYDFFARILYAGGGLKLFHARLGPEVDDVLSEFLDLALAHERRDQPSLQGFLAELRRSGHEIKRELSVPLGVIRVMTVHGAKGLEAPVVILADAAAPPGGARTSSPIILSPSRNDPAGRFLLWQTGGEGPSAAINAMREQERQAEFEEYHRRLYVAMTRAASELYVTGIKPARRGASSEPSWYELIEAGLAQKAVALAGKTAQAGPGGPPRRYPAAARKPGVFKPSLAERAGPPPAWLNQRAPAPPSRLVLEPSAAAHAPQPASGSADPAMARQRGTAIHALLQVLPSLRPQTRAGRGLEALAAMLPLHPELHQDLLDRALAILDDPALAELFGPGSRGEVPVIADFLGAGGPVRLAGRIDRLVTGNAVRIVDFKSDAIPPVALEAVPANYVTQLGLYRLALEKIFPSQPIEAAILWTDVPRLTTIPAAMLKAATNPFTPA